ncbi:MAG: hypothetical protein KF691_11965 [Phycisphaeraceae bacterium]|nr:hypothetical protein [Phycisphaeraceae bacterium]
MRYVLSGICAMATGSSCLAVIVGTTGAGLLVAPPPSLAPGVFANASVVYAINEKQGVLFNGLIDRYLPAIGPAYVLGSALPVNPGPLWVNSHILHFDNQGQPQAGIVTGTVTFDKAIIGVIFTNQRLDLSDAALGNPGTVYPFGVANRGFSSVIDTFTLLSPWTLRFTLANGGAMDEIRVLTVPVPGTLVCGAGLAALARRRR